MTQKDHGMYVLQRLAKQAAQLGKRNAKEKDISDLVKLFYIRNIRGTHTSKRKSHPFRIFEDFWLLLDAVLRDSKRLGN